MFCKKNPYLLKISIKVFIHQFNDVGERRSEGTKMK